MPMAIDTTLPPYYAIDITPLLFYFAAPAMPLTLRRFRRFAATL